MASGKGWETGISESQRGWLRDRYVECGLESVDASPAISEIVVGKLVAEGRHNHAMHVLRLLRRQDGNHGPNERAYCSQMANVLRNQLESDVPSSEQYAGEMRQAIGKYDRLAQVDGWRGVPSKRRDRHSYMSHGVYPCW